MWNLIPHPTCTHTAYFWWTPLPQKQEIPEKNVMMTSSSHFFKYFLFQGSGVCQKYVVWVLVGCKIKFCIQWALSIKIWAKTQGDMSKIRTQKVVFLSSSKINKYYFIIFLRRPILDLKIPLMNEFIWLSVWYIVHLTYHIYMHEILLEGFALCRWKRCIPGSFGEKRSERRSSFDQPSVIG